MQNILLPTDFSKNAFHALCYAIELLKAEKCTFFLLNVYGGGKGFKSETFANTKKSNDALKEASKARLNNTLRKIKNLNNNPNHSYRIFSESGDLIRTVPLLVEKLHIDLMVLGNRGKKSSIPVFLGSTAAKALQSVEKCPVLTVPKNAQLQIPKKIAFASDFKKSYDLKVLDSISTFAKHCGAHIQIVHINEEEELDELQKSNLDLLLNFFGPLASSVERIPNFVSKTKIMQLFLERSDINMLCMIGHEHGLLEKLLREPIIEKMVLKINMPFFIVPDAS